MLRKFYNLLWYPALPFALIAAGPRSARDLRERLGRGDLSATPGAPRVWIHAASVGEIEAVRPVANGLLAAFPGAVLTITTMTAAGRDAASRRIPGAAAWMLSPLDSPRSVRRFLARVRPSLVLITETELWPNFFFESAKIGAKIAIINGRLSERSMRRYLRAKGLFQSALSRVSLILTQSREDASRYMIFDSGAKIVVSGNTKIEQSAHEIEEPIRAELLAFAPERPILVAGSTAPGEETIVAGAYTQLRERFPDLALAIAPRHLDRIEEVEKILQSRAFDYVKASQLDAQNPPGAASVLLLDTMGELRSFYRRGAIAFVGGSLARGRGGQNPAEPALWNVPVLIGPHHANQQEIVAALTRDGGARVIADQRDLINACAQWLEDDAGRIDAGRNARHAVTRCGGGAQIALSHLQTLIGLD